MLTIHITRTGTAAEPTLNFTRSEGVFGQTDLMSISGGSPRAQLGGNKLRSAMPRGPVRFGANRNIIVANLSAGIRTLRTLIRSYGNAEFTTNDSTLRELLGESVTLV